MSLTSKELRRKFIDYFKKQGHAVIPSSSLIPENDATTLFTGSGMQPLVPYLLGEPHPHGKRLVDIQKCLRAEDLDEVGVSPVHHTFFEMMGNWSLGDYFKKEQIPWALDFFVNEVGLDPSRIYVTVFEGEGDISKDDVSIETWVKEFKKFGIEAVEGDKHLVGKENYRIFAYPRKKNWWERNGALAGEPGGPSSEMFYDTGNAHDPKYGDLCHVNCDCRKYIEICNNVFMEYQKNEDGSYKKLAQKNVDVGYGFERILMVANAKKNSFETDLFFPVIQKIEELSHLKYGQSEETDRLMKVIADHTRASVVLIADGTLPSNKEQGYLLRKLIRRTVRFGRKLNLKRDFLGELAQVFVEILGDAYPQVEESKQVIVDELNKEEERFSDALEIGLKKLEHLLSTQGKVSGEEAFTLYESYGFPFEMTKEVASEVNTTISEREFEDAYKRHQDSSRSQSEQKFKGGLEGALDIHLKYHTATHLLHKALRDILGEHVRQMGSNITNERLRFDFSHQEKLTPAQVGAVEKLVNMKIEEKLTVSYADLPRNEAEQSGALRFFSEKYGDTVRVYFIGDNLDLAWSKEFCGGPHVKNTSELGKFKIIKEEAVSRGVRRIKATLSD